MRVDPISPSSQVVRCAVRAIQNGGVVLSPTDTLYGFAVDPFQPSALRRLVEIKARPEEKGLLLLIPEVEWVEKFCDQRPPLFQALVEKLWPGAVTLLLKAGAGAAPPIAGKEGKVGFRIPRSPFLQAWMEALGGPLVSTSANLSGEPPPRTVETLKELFSARVDLFLEGGGSNQGQASTVLDLSAGFPRIIRRGACLKEVQSLLRRLGERPAGAP
ncbi:MAG: L-threonylcarbamoyladenylate synthase [Acidobacteriota bacterium]